MARPKRKEMFMTRRRLRKCRRCGHFPCPHCVRWCDVLGSEDRNELPLEPPVGANIEVELWHKVTDLVNYAMRTDESMTQPACPCSDENECLMSYDDWECNKEVFEIFTSLCKEMEAQGITINGDTTTEDGRLIGISDP